MDGGPGSLVGSERVFHMFGHFRVEAFTKVGRHPANFETLQRLVEFGTIGRYGDIQRS